MSFTVNLSGGGLLINRFNSSNMLKSTQEKLQRQQERDNKVAFFEAQKENLKNRKADSLEEISEKLEMFHNYEDEIAAANQEYNNSQMFHVMDEAEEHGEKIAEAAERNKPKTEEERKEEMVDEALGTEENKGIHGRTFGDNRRNDRADDGKNCGEYGRTSRRGFAGAACYR